jgi:5'-3' exonuclease
MYYSSKFNNEVDIQTICHSYLEGMQWVLSYYTGSVPCWKWFYPFNYAPFSSDLVKHISTFVFKEYEYSCPSTQYQQLLCVLPPQSSHLIPGPLKNLLTDENSPIKNFYPNEFTIDLSGKRYEWEGIVILPIINFEFIKREYLKIIKFFPEQSLKRNIKGKSFLYRYNMNSIKTYRSHNGNIENSHIDVLLFDI